MLANQDQLGDVYPKSVWQRLWFLRSEPLILTRWLFLRALGLIYLTAFLSLLPQILGLVGSNGIVPAVQTLDAVKAQDLSFTNYPTLMWLNSSDAFLQFLCIGGAGLAILVILGVFTAPALFGCWLFYLSLVISGDIFLGYQWDVMLLEVGFLAIFLAPLTILPRVEKETPPSMIVVWLMRWLLFRVMFSSGLVKLLSHDETWANLTALPIHYETQPLPTPLAWYFFHLPQPFHTLSVVMVFVIELFVPFLFFAPRKLRFVGALATVFLQVLILLTGNYTFFNWLTITLCILLLDDDFLRRVFPTSMVEKAQRAMQHPIPRWRKFVTVPLAVLILILSGTVMASYFIPFRRLPQPAIELFRVTAPFMLANRYGLFAVMTTSRPEIIIEGSNDGETWLAYEFPYKAGDVYRTPSFVAPHQPRLDWQMWFAALSSAEANPWFGSFMEHLARGTPEVLALLAYNPFPYAPPRQLRALIYNYRFTTPEEHAADGAWWRRELIGTYYPTPRF